MSSGKIFSMNLFYKSGTNNLKSYTPSMIENDIKIECACNKQINYTKLKTGGNDPSLSKTMRYAQYLRINGSTQSNAQGK